MVPHWSARLQSDQLSATRTTVTKSVRIVSLMTSLDPEKVVLHVSNQKAYVWDPEDVAILRAKHRVTGILTGTLPSVSQQNFFLGLPLLLLPEEVVLLVENGAAVLVDDSTSHQIPTPEELQEWHATRKAEARAQIAAAQANPARDPKAEKAKKSAMGSEAAAKKRAEREARREALRREKALLEGEGAVVASEVVVGPEVNEAQEGTSTPATTAPAALPQHTIVIPGTSSDLSWYKPTEYSDLESASAAGVWSYPSTHEERARCAVFRDLSAQGYFMGGGMRFGGDWLVYPGDPLRYHSHFVATVYPRPTSTLRPIDIVALGRLGTATRKSHLLCGWDAERNVVDYYSIEWAGFG